MSTNTFVRLFNSSRKLYANKCIIPRKFQQQSIRSVSAISAENASVSAIGKERDTFEDVLPSILDSLAANPKFSQVPEVGNWIKKALDYNLTGGKRYRGLATVYAYELLEKPENITEENLRLARVVGWCVEMLQAYFLVVDDMMDDATTRRGMPCWYRQPNVGLGAINDSILIFCSIYETLYTNLGDTRRYVEMLHLLNEAVLFTSTGQHLDFTMAQRNKTDYSMFTLERYNGIVKYKTAYYTFRLPVFLGLTLAGNADKQTREHAQDICFELGRLFQIQDDYMDGFGDQNITGKASTDIQEGKCSWLAVSALQRCSDQQRAIFIENYANKDPQCVQRIKQLYEQLQLPLLYKEEERALYDSIVKRSYALPEKVSPNIFLKLLNLTYKRIK